MSARLALWMFGAAAIRGEPIRASRPVLWGIRTVSTTWLSTSTAVAAWSTTTLRDQSTLISHCRQSIVVSEENGTERKEDR